jgi:HSP20 family protein
MVATRYGNELSNLRREMNQVFDGGQKISTAYRKGEGDGTRRDDKQRTWSPAVDVTENEQAITIYAELPGMAKEDIDIQLTGDTLTLRGERRRHDAQRRENYHRVERQYGQFTRTFQIETPLEAGGVTASYEQGVLTVRLPKQEAVKPRQISINVKQ